MAHASQWMAAVRCISILFEDNLNPLFYLNNNEANDEKHRMVFFVVLGIYVFRITASNCRFPVTIVLELLIPAPKLLCQ